MRLFLKSYMGSAFCLKLYVKSETSRKVLCGKCNFQEFHKKKKIKLVKCEFYELHLRSHVQFSPVTI